MADVIIIGAGPGGISAALYCVRTGLKVTVVYKGISNLERAEKIENYYGFGEPVSGSALFDEGIKNAKRLGVSFIEDEVVNIEYLDKFQIKTTGAVFEAESVIIATGVSRSSPKIDGISKFEGKGVSYCATCDAFFYRNKITAVLGSGEFAFHEADVLADVASKVVVLTNGSEVKNPGEKEIISKKISALEGDSRLEKVTFEDGTYIDLDGLFIAEGIAGVTSLAKKVGAIIDSNKIVIDENCSTNIPGLFAAGDCAGGLLQIAKAVYEGAVAGTNAAKFVRGKINQRK